MGTWCIGAGCGCQNSKIKKKPVNRHSQGIEGGDDTSPGGHSCWLSWLGHGHGEWCGPVSLPEYTRMKKKPCKHQFTGLGVVDTSLCLV